MPNPARRITRATGFGTGKRAAAMAVPTIGGDTPRAGSGAGSAMMRGNPGQTFDHRTVSLSQTTCGRPHGTVSADDVSAGRTPETHPHIQDHIQDHRTPARRRVATRRSALPAIRVQCPVVIATEYAAPQIGEEHDARPGEGKAIPHPEPWSPFAALPGRDRTVRLGSPRNPGARIASYPPATTDPTSGGNHHQGIRWVRTSAELAEVRARRVPRISQPRLASPDTVW